MSSEQTQAGQEQPMRIVLPGLYKNITNILEEQHNIHPYDIHATVMSEDSGYQVVIYFGDGFAHKESQYFSNEAIENMDAGISEFIENVGSNCKDVMIADYFKMMRP